ncbi:MAG TPA: secretin N-terminal domain-containing protein, partial [Phycisphaerales bacterium]|nr:secretin N-terminal domain-containing protein [Phycisphaerales bacterium]
LLVAAPQEAIALLDRFVAVLDQAPVAGTAAVRRFPLTSARATETAQTLQRVFEAARQGRAEQGPAPSFIADERTGSILVSATAGQMTQAQELLGQLDVPAPPDGTEVAILPVRSASAGAVRQVLVTVLGGREAGRAGPAQVTALEEAGIVVVRGAPEQVAEARRLASELDASEMVAGLTPVPIKLERADAESVARALQQFFDDRARSGARPGQRGRQRSVAVVGDRRTGTLVVAAPADELEVVRGLVATFDAPSAARDLQFRVIALRHARAADIQQTLESVGWQLNFRPGGGGARPEPDALIVQVNQRANSVVLMGNGEAFGTVEKIVAAMDQPPTPQAAMAVRALRLEHADPRTVATALQGALATPDWPRWRGPDPDAIRAEVDPRSHALLLIGKADRLEEAARYAQQLDEAAATPGQGVESIQLRFARADQIAQSLTRFYQERARAGGGGASAVAVMGSRDGNVLVVSAPPAEMEPIRELVAQMDQPDEAEGREREIFTLKNADPAEVARTLQEQFPRTLASREGVVIVTAQPSAGSVIVSAPGELFDKVRALVEQLDAPPSAQDTRMVTVTLGTARAEEVAASLARALPKAVKVTVTPVRRSNSLLLTGSEEAIAIVMEQVGKLDAQPARSPMEFRRVRLQHADATEIASTVRSVLSRRTADAADPPAAVSSSTRDNTLLVSATAEQHAELEGIVRELDVPAAGKRTTEFVPLKFADARATADALDVFYGRYAPEAATPGARNVTVIANPASRSLVISADETEWPGIRALLEQLDSEAYDTAKRLEIVPLKHADAVSLAATLTEAFAAPLRAELERQRARAQEQRQRTDRDPGFWPVVPTVLMDDQESVTVVAERVTNSLIVSAPRQTAERIRAVIVQLDVPEFARLPEARVIPLRTGTATAVASTLRQMFTDQTARPGGAGGGPRSVLIAGDDRAGVLIVRADEEQFAQVRALAETLQQEGDKSRAQVRVLRLTHLPAGRLAGTIRTSFTPIAQAAGETLAVEVDRASNALVVVAGEQVFAQVKALVAELDVPPPGAAEGAGEDAAPGLGQSVFVIDVENNAPAEIARLLEQMGVTRAQALDRPGVVSEPVIVTALTTR